MNKVKEIISEIKKGNTKPIYFLMGEEPYYIDVISSYIEKNVLSEEEKGFNQTILYGRDVTVEDIISNAKRYPMMAEKQVIIVKEAQILIKTIDKLESYAENPQATTILVICYKYKKLDKRKKVYKTIAKTGVIFESKRLYESNMPDWIRNVLAEKKYTISQKALQMLVEFLGVDLGKVNNELEKLQLVIPQQTEITALHIEKNIGISKDYNNFELRSAVGERNVLKANSIINYFSQNPKSNPTIVTISLLFSYFSLLLKYHAAPDKNQYAIAKTLGINPFFVKDYQIGARNYPMKKISQIISLLRDADMKSKGVGASNLPQADLLKELLFKIMH